MLGYTVLQGLLSSTKCQPTWQRMEKIFEGSKEKILQQFGHLFDVQGAEEQRRSPELPQRWQSHVCVCMADTVVDKGGFKRLKDYSVDLGQAHPQ